MATTTTRLAFLLQQVKRLQADGVLPTRPTLEETIDWAYGNTVIENDQITRASLQRLISPRAESEDRAALLVAEK